MVANCQNYELFEQCYADELTAILLEKLELEKYPYPTRKVLTPAREVPTKVNYLYYKIRPPPTTVPHLIRTPSIYYEAT